MNNFAPIRLTFEGKWTVFKKNVTSELTQEEVENLNKSRKTKEIQSAVQNLSPQDKLETNK